MTWAILNADARHVPLRDQSVQCIVTSPPYWGLRDYKLKPLVWGGDSSCEHEWVEERIYREMRRGKNLAQSPTSTRGGGKKIATVPAQVFKHSFCHLCDAWLGRLGLEPSPDLYLEHIVQVFREAYRVLRKDGTLWVNMGDSYTAAGRSGHVTRIGRKQGTNRASANGSDNNRATDPSLSAKNLVGMPWRLAFALQADGWTLRRDIIWHKLNAMPESAEDRPTTAHEYIFLFAKSRKYYYDGKAIAEPTSEDTHARYARARNSKKYADGGPGHQTILRTFDHMRLDKEGPNSRIHVNRDPAHQPEQSHRRDDVRPTGWHNSPNYRDPGVHPKAAPADSGIRANESFSAAVKDLVDTRNSRSVWSMATQAYSGAHFATFPEELASRCIKAGSKKGDIVLDIFSGAGTTVLTADKLERVGIGTELGPDYCKQARERVFNDAPLLNYQGVA